MTLPEQAEGCTDLAALAAAQRDCTACPELLTSRTRVVPGQFPAGARLLMMGEAPGAQEDQAGVPFVGRSGRLLDTLLAEVGGDRTRTAVLNTLGCRPPGNRAPRRAESRRCRGWVARQLDVAAPELILTLGASAAAWFLGPVRLGEVRGRVHQVEGARVLATYHPSAALRSGPGGQPAALLRADLMLAVELTGGRP